ncbi:MAG: hypothetical protein SGI88_04395 [Candidatus Hydrogenedentes bacterium]|nr:hypothetical protein [Candidatus Hydrogenedentota bacterium]
MHRPLSLLLIFMCGNVALAQRLIEIGSAKQLFIDHRFIAKSERIELRMNQAQKMGRILDEDGQYIRQHVSRVLEDNGKIRLYTGADTLNVLESDDGMNFKQVGSIPNGVLPTIFLDPHESDPAKRYKLFRVEHGEPFNRETDGVFAHYSADGVNFTPVGRVLPYYTDNPQVVWWDARINKYVIYTRALALNNENQRRIARIETDDVLKPWPYTASPDDKMFFTTSNTTVVLQADAEDDPFSDIYYNAATLYPEAQDAYFMFTAQFRHFAPQRQPFIRPREPGQWEDFGLLEIQLAVSRDGIDWQRPSREPYFPTGLADEWDRWYAVMAPGMVKRGNYFYQYYMSSGRTHDSVVLRPEYDSVTDVGGIGMVKQRIDGFISADADHKGGWIETPLITFTGTRLRLNIDTGSMGTAFVELRDADDKPISGFTLEDCEEVGGNFIDQVVHWKGNADVSALAGTPVRIYFKLTRAKLYSFVFSAT